jgi:hypothetical protein
MNFWVCFDSNDIDNTDGCWYSITILETELGKVPSYPFLSLLIKKIKKKYIIDEILFQLLPMYEKDDLT